MFTLFNAFILNVILQDAVAPVIRSYIPISTIIYDCCMYKLNTKYVDLGSLTQTRFTAMSLSYILIYLYSLVNATINI